MSNLYIRRFIERLEHLESRGQKDFNCAIQDAQRLRNEITNLLLDLEESRNNNQIDHDPVTVELVGGSF